MSGTHQSMIVCERILSMVEGDPEVVSHFNVLDSILLLSQAYSKINIKKFHHKIQNEGAGLQIVDTNTRLVKPSMKRKSKHILPPRGMNANAIKQEQQRISLPLDAVGVEGDFGDFLFFFEILGVVGGGMFNRLIEGDGFFK